MPETLREVPLSFPSLLTLAASAGTDAPRSWIQLARTGSFVSNRYGKFSITTDDLSTMLRNFNEITPKAPTELPIDYDHLSMAPQKPGDGAAAGWMKRLELREDGEELWAEVEWTPDAAGLIRKKAYRFISPSFVKDHVHKDGREIGTTLLAAAITNHPFLEGMKALTLYNFAAIGDLALREMPVSRALHLSARDSKVGQMVAVHPDPTRTPELLGPERAVTYKVAAENGEFVRLENAKTGHVPGWFHVEQLAPAPSPLEENPMPSNPVTELRATLSKLEADVVSLTKRRATPAPPRETFDALALRLSRERGIDLRAAIHLAGVQRPDLALARP
jgi:hypothetical protein